ncbi:cytidine deaminase [Microlunatus parietis]|uniref:Cytidine deaminase n=1 Tax=Microlunatus parietis TaxID=682979 RepID=A0A7Y9I5D2_9ACTN|nr:cytidine deaminase [Microlunatus parietis]NYE70311.1 cytidine deaminase [Microlunatus parietis]
MVDQGPDPAALEATVTACRELIERRFPDGDHQGAAAVLLGDGTILTGTSPDFVNPSTEVCHELEPYCAAYRLDQRIVASVCLHRDPDRGFVVLSPCGICRERLTRHGPDVLAAVAEPADPTVPRWLPLRDLLPHYWLTAFPGATETWRA